MLTGKDLGAAIAAAIRLKGVSQADVAREFHVKAPSISDWINRGTIRKDRLEQLFAYFSDVVGPEHWGMRGGHFVNEPPAPPYAANVTPMPASPAWEAELLALARSINETGRRELIGMARLLATQKPAAAKNRSSS
jgi:hypothetical protein